VIVVAIDVRVYHGVHFRAADVQGAQIGQHVAEWQFQRYFQPVAEMPGLPNTGAGGGEKHTPSGWLLLGLGGALALGWGLRRKQRAA
jgi:hypothetical protein